MGAPAMLTVRWLGRTGYADAQRLQHELVAARRGGEGSDTLLLLEHPPVVTLGRGADPSNVRASPEALRRAGVELHATGRGGDVTYHGPGQLVGYPILALPAQRRDAHRYLRDLERALIRAVAAWGVRASRIPGLTGIWVRDLKLAAIGVRLSTGWVTSHGFALNVDVDLSGFDRIVPCGITDRGVTSLRRLLGGAAPSLTEVATRVAVELADVLGMRAVAADERTERLAAAGTRPLSSQTRRENRGGASPAHEPGP